MTGRDLKEIRLGMHLSLREFALVVGVAYSLVAHWESGRRQLPEQDAVYVRARLREYSLQQIAFYQDVITVHL